MRDVLVGLLLSGLMGLLGQGIRAVVGLKSAATLSAGVPTQQSEFNVAYFGLSLMIGFIAGVLAGIGIGVDQVAKVTPDNLKLLLGIAAAGYAGADFIENAFTRLIPGLAVTPTPASAAGAAAPAPPPPVSGAAPADADIVGLSAALHVAAPRVNTGIWSPALSGAYRHPLSSALVRARPFPGASMRLS